MLAEPLAVTLRLADVLDELGVVYAVGGSLASAVHGIGRATMDADLVADLAMAHIPPLVQAAGVTSSTSTRRRFATPCGGARRSI